MLSLRVSPLRAAVPALVAALLACSGAGPESVPGDVSGGVVAAEIGGDKITVDEIDAWIKDDLFQRETDGKNTLQLYQLRESALDRMIEERLLRAEASRQGLETEALLQLEAKPPATPEDLVRAFYDENKERLGAADYESLAPRIRQYLDQQAAQQARGAYIDSLRERAKVTVHLEPPRAKIASTGPTTGPAEAPVTIVEFSDYQCPFCRRAHPNLKEVLRRYPEQVKLVYRHFPLDSIHPQARAAAEASACAQEQGKFWEYHDLVFTSDAGFSPEALSGYAEQVGLDLDAFNRCVEARTFKDAVEADLRAGRAAGVTGTPAFFVNGIPMSGARPVDDFVRMIESELKRLGVESSPASQTPSG